MAVSLSAPVAAKTHTVEPTISAVASIAGYLGRSAYDAGAVVYEAGVAAGMSAGRIAYSIGTSAYNAGGSAYNAGANAYADGSAVIGSTWSWLASATPVGAHEPKGPETVDLAAPADPAEMKALSADLRLLEGEIAALSIRLARMHAMPTFPYLAHRQMQAKLTDLERRRTDMRLHMTELRAIPISMTGSRNY